MRLLIVEDEYRIAEILTDALRRADFICDAVRTAADAVRPVSYDEMILDLGLPDADGRGVVETLAPRARTCPC